MFHSTLLSFGYTLEALRELFKLLMLRPHARPIKLKSLGMGPSSTLKTIPHVIALHRHSSKDRICYSFRIVSKRARIQYTWKFCLTIQPSRIHPAPTKGRVHCIIVLCHSGQNSGILLSFFGSDGLFVK